MKIEYQVRPVTRFMVTRYHSGGGSAGVEGICEVDSLYKADRICRAMVASEPGAVNITDPGLTEVMPD